MPAWSFYDPNSGLFVGFPVNVPNDQLAENTPAGSVAIEGRYDALAQRVDITADPPIVIDYQPPAPPDTEWLAWAWDSETRRWVSTPTLAAVGRDVRAARDRLLAACDWVVSRSVETGEAVPTEWRQYRQALRDVPLQPGFPTEIDWPTIPN